MHKGKSTTVVPTTTSPDVYTDDRLGMPEQDLDNRIDGSVEARFGAAGCLEDGCSGKLAIDTTYENTSQTEMDVVRSDVTRYEDLPAPRDTKLWDYPHRRH